MQRFVYTPKVQAYISLEEQNGEIIDISNDIISGSISLRLNAMSEAELVLQNKHGRYARGKTSGTTMINPMDRIIIRMSRIGQPANVFAGYVDETPHYQLYSGPVTLRASCKLKLLQHTYFDPGLRSVATLFQEFGWAWDATSGTFFAQNKFDAVDSTGSVKELITGVLTNIGQWNKELILIEELPKGLIDDLSKLIESEKEEIEADYLELLDKLKKLFAVDTESRTDVGGSGPGGTALPVTGNIDPIEIATMLMDNGASQDLATKLLAIAQRESNFISDNINYNGGGDESSGNGSYDFGLFQFNTVHANGATNGGKGLEGPSSSASLKELKSWIPKQPQWVQTFYAEMSDPTLSIAKAVRFGKQDPDVLPAWVPGGTKSGKTWREGITDAELQQCSAWVATAFNKRNTAKSTVAKGSTDPTKTKDESKVGMAALGTKYTMTHATSGLDSRREGSSGDYGAIDLFGNANQAVYAPEDGKIIGWGSSTPGSSITLLGSSGQEYWLGHLNDSDRAPQESTVYAGQKIATLYPQGSNTHLHFAGKGWYAGVNPAAYSSSNGGQTVTVPYPPISGSGAPGGAPDVGGGTGGLAGTGGISPGAVADIARQTFFTYQTGGTFDLMASNLLKGERALANDISLMEWMSQIITGAGRVFTSDPEGNFRAFFPDYFGIYGGQKGGQTPVFYIAEIEILDLTIQQNDTDLTTHVFGSGPVISYQGGINLLDRLQSTVASVEKPAFKWFLTIDEGKKWNAQEFLKKYGARPYQHDMPYIGKPELIWMGTWMKFLELWSKRFSTSASFTFLPEIRPGYLINIGNRVQMFVESVTHSWNYTGGFKTSAQLSSAATLTDDIDWLPRAGVESVLDQALANTGAPAEDTIEKGAEE